MRPQLQCPRCSIGVLGATRVRRGARWPPGWRRWGSRSCSAPGRSTGRWRSVDGLLRRWPGIATSPIEAGDNEGAATADLVVIATPWDAAATDRPRRSPTSSHGKVVISMANALARVGNEFQPLVPPRGSVAASVQAAVPDCQVAAAFHHVPAKELGDLDHPIESDVLICSDDRDATEVTARDRRARSPDCARSTPASSRTPRRSRRSPRCCSSSTCATRRGSR